jgi:hypothetical protein
MDKGNINEAKTNLIDILKKMKKKLNIMAKS